MNDHRNHHSPAPATHELLSAYFDRETTREEAVEIERLLERSPAARQMLDDFAELSDLLHELPRHTLDANFADRVVQQTKSPPISVDVLTIPSATRTSRWRWRVGLGLAATAAAACVIVMVVGSWGRNRGVEVAQRDQTNFAADVTPTPASTSENEALRNSGVGGASIALQPADESATQSGARKGAFRVAGELGKAKLVGTPTGGGAGLRFELLKDQDLKNVTPGKVIEVLRTSDDDVSVMRFTVVDVQEGFATTELLLNRNSIRSDEAPKGVVAEARQLETADDERSGEMRALFVRAPREQFESFLSQIQNEAAIVGVRLEPAIAADSLNQIAPEAAAQSRVSLAEQQFGVADKEAQNRRDKGLKTERKVDSVPSATTPRLKNADVAAKSAPPSATLLPALAAAPGGTGKQLGNDSQNAMSRQRALKVPMGAIEQSNRRNLASNQADRPATATSREALTQDAKDGTTTVNKPAEPSADDTLQVLIVFQQRPAPASDKARGRKPGSVPPVKKS